MPDGVLLTRSNSVADEALAGLQAVPKTLPPKLFYDEAGCELFGQITGLPEYYVTRTERALLAGCVADIIDRLPAHDVALVEYGASSEDKAALLLDGGLPAQAYVPIDVAAPALQALQVRMRASHPMLAVYPVAGDFLATLRLPEAIRGMPALGFFPGSTIGNMDPADATAFLERARRSLGVGAAFLVGVDLRKDPAILVPAYDDDAGVTAAFNLNLLVRLNREADADFDVSSFRHRAVWNEVAGRIEMHLVSERAQLVHVAGEEIVFAAGESIHTENSYKHSIEGFQRLALLAGWVTANRWVDDQGLFSLHLLKT